MLQRGFTCCVGSTACRLLTLAPQLLTGMSKSVGLETAVAGAAAWGAAVTVLAVQRTVLRRIGLMPVNAPPWRTTRAFAASAMLNARDRQRLLDTRGSKQGCSTAGQTRHSC